MTAAVKLAAAMTADVIAGAMNANQKTLDLLITMVSFSGPLQDFPNQFKNRKAKSAKLTQKYCMVNIEQAVFQG